MNDENFLAQKEARESVSDPCDNCKLKECALSKIENMVYEAENRKYLVQTLLENPECVEIRIR